MPAESHLHETASVKPPPTKGPRTEATPKTVPKTPWNIGRLRSGTMGIIMIMTPEKMPAPPTPAIDRPTMNTIELGAAPQMTDPSSNTKILHKKVLSQLALRHEHKSRREGVLCTSQRRTERS